MPKKLKRFLLSYDPPGLGFEFAQDDGGTEIVHKDLPPATRVTTQEEILIEVDRLIAEDDHLTRKRHRPALIQLLGRLYQVEVVSGEEEDPETPVAKTKSSPKAESPSSSTLMEGQIVVLVGLKADQAVHNGEMGVLTKCRHDKKKFEVQMKTSGQEVKVKGTEHLVLVATKGGQYSGLVEGAAVVIRGLRNHTELNGCLGRVVECHEETHRFEVRAVESGQLFRVKQENLVPIDSSSLPAGMPAGKDPHANTGTTPGKEKGSMPTESPGSVAGGGENDDVFEAGSAVELQGLKTAMAYNGQQAEVLSVDRVRCRYEIKLGDGSVKTIRAENVRLIARPSKSSPRRRKEGGSKAADRGK